MVTDTAQPGSVLVTGDKTRMRYACCRFIKSCLRDRGHDDNARQEQMAAKG